MSRTSPYDTDLDRNPANFQPLTPLTLLERAASVFPDQTAIVHGPLRRSYARVLRARAPACLGAGASAASGAATRCRPCSPTRRRCWKPLRRADGGRACSTPSTRGSTPPIIAFQLDHGEAKVLITDREFSKVVKEALALCQGQAAGHRLRRSGVFRRGRAPRRNRIRGFHQGRRSELRLGNAGRRMGRHRAELHLGHHRRSQGRGLSSPRRLSARGRQCADLRHGPSTASICGRCRCSTATAGASPGRSRSVAGTHVCLRAVRAKAMYERSPSIR